MLQQLTLHDFRNYQRCEFTPSSGMNIVLGENGSGKSSLLEALYFLGSGRSFRHPHLSRLIRDQADMFVLHARVMPPSLLASATTSLGVMRTRSGESVYKVNGEVIRQASDFVGYFPVQVLHPESVELVFGAPGARRRFIDWGVFHVEHSFVAAWKGLRVALMQRNALLKTARINQREMEIWDQQVVTESDRISRLRDEFINRLRPCFYKVLDCFSTELSTGVDFSHSPGWTGDLSALLEAGLEKDRQRGFTRYGAHRFDLLLRYQGKPAKDVLSRGQAKIVSYALVLAQVSLLEQYKNKKSTLLIDDLGSELDKANREILIQVLEKTDAQVIITALPDGAAASAWQQTQSQHQAAKMFHVEHGVIKPY